jgi:KDO2-lipid IV(A) lauroyltransferase
MKSRHPIRHRLETVMTWLAFRTLPFLPRRAIAGLARFFGCLGSRFSPKLRRIGLANLDLAFGETRTVAEKNKILRDAFSSFALVMLDAFWFSRKSNERIARHVRFDDAFAALFQDKPHICVTAHYGNWEVLGMAINARGYQLHSVAKPLKNPEVDEQFISARRQTGQQIIRRDGAVRGLLKAVLAGDKVALVLDQNTRKSEGGRFYPFFGRPVLVSTAPAALAIKTNTDLFIGMMRPLPGGDYLGDFALEIPVAPYLTMEKDAAIDALTLKITSVLEDVLRQRPQHWLWMYKRWKYMPDDADATRYPWYARRV